MLRFGEQKLVRTQAYLVEEFVDLSLDLIQHVLATEDQPKPQRQ